MLSHEFRRRSRYVRCPRVRGRRIILFTFPSEAQARAWYADPDYQALCEYRRAGTQLEFLTIVRGLPPR